MADLDIFLSKKNKKKVKGRKYDNPDDIAKRLKESEKKLEKEWFKVEPVKKTLDEVLSTSISGEELAATEKKPEKKKEEEEWKDFQDEAQKDMTNLKISKLQIEDDDDGGMGYGSGEDDRGFGMGNKSDGVWSKNLERQELEQPAPEVEVPSPKEEVKSTTGSYVAPHLRNAPASSLPRASNRKPKTAPDITNTMAFPSLSDSLSSSATSPWGRKKGSHNDDRGFENVKHGSTKSHTEEYASPKLTTANRFTALNDNS